MDDVTGDFNRTPSESVLDPMLAEVQEDNLKVPQDEGEGLLEAFEDAVDEDES